MIFRALWPITDETATFFDLCDQATADLEVLIRQAHARPTGFGRFSVADSRRIPGSGRTTRWVLLYECPAVRIPRRRLTVADVRAALTTTTPTHAEHQETAA